MATSAYDSKNNDPRMTESRDSEFRHLAPYAGSDISEDEGETTLHQPVRSFYNSNESSDESDIYDDLFVEPPTKSSRMKFTDERSFYNKLRPQKSEEEIKASKTFPQMSLDEQGEFLSSQIAEKFFKWIDETGMETLRINEDTLKVLFQVGMDNPSVRSLDVSIKELSTVPWTIADSFHNYEKSERAALHRQILWDAFYETISPRYMAFGKRHPKSHKAWKKNVKDRWFTTSAVSEDIISGHALWGELLGTKVLDNYCKWLRDNPHSKRPQYLQSMGYLDRMAEDDRFNDAEMEEEFKMSGQRNYWLFDKVKYLEEEEKFKETLQANPEILEMLQE